MKTSLHALISGLRSAAFTASLLSFTPGASAQTGPNTQPTAPAAPAATTIQVAESAPPPAPPPTPPAVVQPEPTAATNPASPPSCTVRELADLHAAAGQFLVEVHARQNMTATTGVVIGPDRVVVPDRRVLDERWPITVYFADGKKSAATVLHHLSEPNLAVLKLETPPPNLAPRTIAKTNPTFGTPVVSVGESLHGEKTTAWDMKFAHVTNLVEGQIAAAPSPAVGAPILSCSGELVGIQMKNPWDESPRSGSVTGPELAKLLSNAPKPEPRGQLGFGFLGPKVVVALRPGEIGAGLKFGFAHIGWAPRFFLNANFGAQWLTVPERSDYADATQVFRWRTQLEGVLGFNHVFDIGSPGGGFINLGLSPYIGVAERTDYTSLRRLRADMTTVGETSMENHTDPLIGFVLRVPKYFDLMYQFQLDLNAPKQSIHTLGAMVKF